MFDFHRHVAATAYGIIAIASGIVLGRAAEGCDVLNTCTSRGKWVIACGVLSFVISMAAMIVSLVVRDLGKYINSAIFAFLFIWWIPGAAVTASVRSIQVPIVQGFAFLALLTAFCMVSVNSCTCLGMPLSDYLSLALMCNMHVCW